MKTAIELPARLDTAAAVALWAGVLKHDGGVTLDGSAVAHLGTAGLQVLLRVAALCHDRGAELLLLAPSPVLRDEAALLGAGDLIDKWSSR